MRAAPLTSLISMPNNPYVCPHLVCAARLFGVKSSYFSWDAQQWWLVSKRYGFVEQIPQDFAPIAIRILISRGLKDVEIARRLGYVGSETLNHVRRRNKIPRDYRKRVRSALQAEL